MRTGGTQRNGRGAGQDLLSLFVRAGRNAEQAAVLLEQLIYEWPDSQGLQREVLTCEQAGDRFTHDILHRLHDVRRTPFHREDVFALASAIDDLPTLDGVRSHLVQIKELENDGDRVTRDALASLFDRGIDPMVVIRWKDIIERLEHGIDGCEHAAHVLEGMLVRQR